MQYREQKLPRKREEDISYHLTFCEECNAVLLTATETQVPETLQIPEGFMEKINQVAKEVWKEGRRQDVEAQPQLRWKEVWARLIEKLREFIIDLDKTYGPSALVGTIRIAAEGPAFAERAAEGKETISKVLEISVGENAYSIEVGVTPEGSLSCDITGRKITREVRLDISVRSETGEEIFSTQTDTHGNSHFLLGHDQVPRDMCVLTFTLDGDESHLPLRVPERRTSPSEH